jgi:hypothetical protein
MEPMKLAAFFLSSSVSCALTLDTEASRTQSQQKAQASDPLEMHLIGGGPFAG